MRSFALTSLLVVWLGAVSGANATEVHLIGRSPQTSPGGSGCGPAAVVTLQLPQGARSLNPTILGVGSFLDGPDGFGGESGASDGH